jgi:hypothetical protein
VGDKSMPYVISNDDFVGTLVSNNVVSLRRMSESAFGLGKLNNCNKIKEAYAWY